MIESALNIDTVYSGNEAARARAVFFRSLSTLIGSGVHLRRALEVLAAQETYPPLKNFLPLALLKLNEGNGLAKSLEAPHGCRSCFTSMQIRLIEVAERTGCLHLILERVAQETERSNELRYKVISALVYPLVTLAGAMVAVVGLQNLVFKDLLNLLSSLGSALPWPTRLLQLTSSLLSNPVFLVVFLGGVIGLMRGLRSLLCSPEGRLRAWQGAVKIRVVGQALNQAAAVQFSRALALCLEAGLALPLALDLAAAVSMNPMLPEMMAPVIREVIDGVPLPLALRAPGVFPSLMLSCMVAGDESGKVPLMLEKVAQVLEESLQLLLDAATTVIQPILLGLVGAIVGFVVIATFLPLSHLVETL